MMNIKKIVCSFLLLASGNFFASVGPILSIVPKEGTTLPTSMLPGYNVQAYYTVTNRTRKNLQNLYVANLPSNVEQITTGGLYPDSLGATFNLAPGASGTLELNISGPTQNSATKYLFIATSGGTSGSGTAYPLQVVESAWLPISVSYEIIYTADVADNPSAFVQAYKEGGTNPITEQQWQDYDPPTGYTKNTTRYLQFQESMYITSPGYPNGVTTYIETEDGYTWGLISNVVNAMWPYDDDMYPGTQNNPFLAGNVVTAPDAGGLKVTANYKAQQMKFYACENGVAPGTPGAVPILRYFIIDPWGNKYIMHASDYSTPSAVTLAFEQAVLPNGWTKSPEYLTEDFILYPAQGVGNTYEYNLVRDNENNTYHQMYWSPTGATTVTSQVQGTGMPVWGGLFNDSLTINNGFNNVVYGGGGVNQFIFPILDNTDNNSNTGTNTIMGFNPAGGDTLNFQGAPYTYLLTPIGVQISVGQSGLVIILSGIFTFETDWVVAS